tara:strand:- start:296 stop:892 length:597 start_codon:yes stop_codon:yes gene_type:complete
MKPLLSILLICSIGFTQELTVDGNLNVTGNIQNQTIDSLLQVILDLQNQLSLIKPVEVVLDTSDIAFGYQNPQGSEQWWQYENEMIFNIPADKINNLLLLDYILNTEDLVELWANNSWSVSFSIINGEDESWTHLTGQSNNVSTNSGDHQSWSYGREYIIPNQYHKENGLDIKFRVYFNCTTNCSEYNWVKSIKVISF